jgi:hypothetical protein
MSITTHTFVVQLVRLLTCLLLSFFVACDVIEKDNYLIHVALPEAKKKVLIEDYTGMKCPNCPYASSTIDSLKSSYGDNIVAVSIHSGIYAKPSGIFSKDFRTEAGNTYTSSFSIDSHPTGLVDRTVFNNKLKIDFTEWNGAIIQQIGMESPLGIDIKNHWQDNSRTLSVSVDVSIFSAIADELALQVWLVEDSIIAPQLKGPDIVPNYVHRHVLRGALNGTWGESLSGVVKNAILNKQISYTLPTTYNQKHCNIVAFVYRVKDKSIVQVNESKLWE